MKRAELQGRKEKLFASASEEKLDAWWVVKPENVRYLTGFHGEDCTLLAGAGRYYLITDRRYEEEAGKTAFVDEVVIRSGAMAKTAGDLCRRLSPKKTAVTAANVNCADYSDFCEAADGVDTVLCRHGLPEALRIRKSAAEVDCIRRSLCAAEEGFGRFLRHIEAGMSERILAARLEWELRQAGADGAAFETICAAGDHGSRPHARPAERTLTSGSSLLVDWGAQIDGYNSDLTRVIALDTMPSEIEELAEVVLAAQDAALEVLSPDVEARAVDSAARGVIEDAGYGRYFSHGTGHGIGLQVHEQPALAPERRERLQAGMVVTIEPAIYIPGRCGVRIEEMACITGDGYISLSGLDRSPLCIGSGAGSR